MPLFFNFIFSTTEIITIRFATFAKMRESHHQHTSFYYADHALRRVPQRPHVMPPDPPFQRYVRLNYSSYYEFTKAIIQNLLNVLPNSFYHMIHSGKMRCRELDLKYQYKKDYFALTHQGRIPALSILQHPMFTDILKIPRWNFTLTVEYLEMAYNLFMHLKYRNFDGIKDMALAFFDGLDEMSRVKTPSPLIVEPQGLTTLATFIYGIGGPYAESQHVNFPLIHIPFLSVVESVSPYWDLDMGIKMYDFEQNFERFFKRTTFPCTLDLVTKREKMEFHILEDTLHDKDNQVRLFQQYQKLYFDSQNIPVEEFNPPEIPDMGYVTDEELTNKYYPNTEDTLFSEYERGECSQELSSAVELSEYEDSDYGSDFIEDSESMSLEKSFTASKRRQKDQPVSVVNLVLNEE